MNQRAALAARRRLLAASVTLQRVRLAHDIDRLRDAVRPSRWAAPLFTAALLAAAGLAAASRGAAPTRPSAWAARALMLWRAARALRRWTRSA